MLSAELANLSRRSLKRVQSNTTRADQAERAKMSNMSLSNNQKNELLFVGFNQDYGELLTLD